MVVGECCNMHSIFYPKIKDNPRQIRITKFLDIVVNASYTVEDACRHLKIKHIAIQTRSGDEGETQFVICQHCGKNLR